MKTLPPKRRGAVLLVVGLLLTIFPLSADSQRRRKQPCVQTLAQCDNDGCGGDPKLNAKKNITQAATDPEDWTLSQIVALNEESPDSWSSGRDRGELEELAEGTPVRVKGYLIDAFVTRTPESTNCFLRGPENNDFHLNLVRRSDLDKSQSVVVEITPRFRLDGWEISKLEALADGSKYVRVTGYLMFDTAHPGASNHRATAWEVHPVTKFEACVSTVTRCNQNAAGAWRRLEVLQ